MEEGFREGRPFLAEEPKIIAYLGICRELTLFVYRMNIRLIGEIKRS